MKNLDKSNTPENKKDLAQTPVWLINTLEHIYLGGNQFSLDVCAHEKTAKSGCFYSLELGTDGLKEPWFDFNWCNPPFSDILPWMQKAALEIENGNTTFLIYPSNMETKYAQFAHRFADKIIHMPFRLCFLRPDGTQFLDSKGKKQSPQFPCSIAVFSPLGYQSRHAKHIYIDFKSMAKQLGYLK